MWPTPPLWINYNTAKQTPHSRAAHAQHEAERHGANEPHLLVGPKSTPVTKPPSAPLECRHDAVRSDHEKQGEVGHCDDA